MNTVFSPVHDIQYETKPVEKEKFLNIFRVKRENDAFSHLNTRLMLCFYFLLDTILHSFCQNQVKLLSKSEILASAGLRCAGFDPKPIRT